MSDYPNSEPATSVPDAALTYAQQEGWHVFPAPPGTRKSCKSAKFSGGRPWGKTTDPSEIKRDFARWPDANVGIATGNESGIFVIDVDTPEGHGRDGFASLKNLEAKYGLLPFTRMAESPSGSLHLYFRHPRDRKIKNSTSDPLLGQGIDVRGDGGMVIAPPSVRGDGIYRWLNENAPIADAPAWLIELTMEQERTNKTVDPAVGSHTATNNNAPANAASSGGPAFDTPVPEYLLGGTGAGISLDPRDRLDTSIERIKTALNVIDPDLPRANWIAVACGLFKQLGDEQGFEVFHEWSKTAKDKYPGEREIGKQWDSVVRGNGYGWSLGTVFWLAGQADPKWWMGERKEEGGTTEDDQNSSDPPPQKEDSGETVNGGDQTNSDGGQQEQPSGEAKDKQSDSQPQKEGSDGEASSGDQAKGNNGNQQQGKKPNDGGGAQQQRQWRAAIPLINFSTWDDVPVPRQEWSVYERIPTGFTCNFSGQGAAGKSLIQLHLSIATTLGKDWLGVVPKQGNAIFIDAEDDDTIIHLRMADILHHYGARFTDLKDKFYPVSLTGEDAVLGWYNRKESRVKPTKLYERFFEMAGDLKPRIIGIASAADVFAGNELDRSQVQQFIGLLTRLARVAYGSVVLISHPSLTGISTNTGLSGSTQWHNSVRARFYLKSVSPREDEQPDTNLRQIEFKKNNYGPISASIPLRYTNGLFLPITGATLDAEAKSEQAKEVFVAILRRFNNEERNANANPGPIYAPTLFAREQEAKAANCSKADLASAMRTLLHDRKVIHETYGKPSNPHQRLVVNPYADRPDEEPF